MTSERKIANRSISAQDMPETAEKILSGYVVGAPEGKKEPAWLSDMRSEALEYLQKHGLPTPKLEGWKFTNLIPSVREYGAVRGMADIVTNTVEGVNVQDIAIGGQYWVRNLMMEEPHKTDPNTNAALWHLANLYFRDGVAVDVPADTQVQDPLQIDIKCAGGAFYVAHMAINVGDNASLTIIEDHRGTGKFWKNILSKITVAPGARLTHVRIQDDDNTAVYTQTTRVTVAKDAVYDMITLATGAALSRNQVHVVLTDTGAQCHLNGVALMRGTQHADTTILVEHKAPHCESKQNMRNVLDDQAHGVFQGKILVHQPAQKTNGYQLSRALVLSEGAEMDTKPELEIYADDVKCSHGSTTGQLDSEPLFYMQSRGIGKDEARALLIRSFIAEGLELSGEQAWHEMLEKKVESWLL